MLLGLPRLIRISPAGEIVKLALRGERPYAVPGLAAAAACVDDWQQAGALAIRNRVEGWFMAALDAADLRRVVPADVWATMRESVRLSAMRALTMAPALEEVLHELRKSNLPAMVLKGPALAERFYADPALRPYGDIDLLVPLAEHACLAEILGRLDYVVDEEHGGTQAVQSGTAEFPYETKYVGRNTGMVLDIHYDPFQLGLKPLDMEGVWQRAEPRRLYGQEVLTPGLNDLLLILAVHLHRHSFERLLWLKDVDLIVRREGLSLDWPWLADRAAAEGVSSSLATVLRLSRRLLATPLPAEASLIRRGWSTAMVHSLLWNESYLLSDDLRQQRWRRAVQFVPWEGVRGVLPSLIFMERRLDKLRAIWTRLARSPTRPFSPPTDHSPDRTSDAGSTSPSTHDSRRR